MSQGNLADRLGITFQQIQKYEKATNRITMGRLAKIADVLGVSVTFLLTGSEEKRGERGVNEGASLLKTAGALEAQGKRAEEVRFRLKRLLVADRQVELDDAQRYAFFGQEPE